MTNNNKTFRTSDFHVSVYCFYKKIKLLEIDRSNPKQAIFIFEENAEREKMVEEYWNGKALVEPLKFVMLIRELKQRIFTDSLK